MVEIAGKVAYITVHRHFVVGSMNSLEELDMGVLDGALTVVTGGGTGLGRALALEAARRGSRILIAEMSDASDAVEELRGTGATAEWLETDVADYAAVRRLADYARATFGGVNVLINNAAGGAGMGSLEQADPEAAARTFQVNIIGYFNTIHAFGADLRSSATAGKPAHILNVGSEHSLGVPPHVAPASAYTISKYAELGVTDVARRDFAGSGVEISLLAPGWVRTEKVSAFMAESPEFAAQVEPYVQSTPQVAYAAFDGLLDRRYLIVTNPKSVPFATAHAEAVLAELKNPVTPDPNACPVAFL